MDDVSVKQGKHKARHGGTTMRAVLSRYTGWIGAYPSPHRSAPSIANTLQHPIGRREQCDLPCFDNAEGYIAAARHLQVRYDTRCVNRPQSNGVAERSVRTLLRGRRIMLICIWAATRLLVRGTQILCLQAGHKDRNKKYIQHGLPTSSWQEVRWSTHTFRSTCRTFVHFVTGTHGPMQI